MTDSFVATRQETSVATISALLNVEVTSKYFLAPEKR